MSKTKWLLNKTRKFLSHYSGKSKTKVLVESGCPEGKFLVHEGSSSDCVHTWGKHRKFFRAFCCCFLMAPMVTASKFYPLVLGLQPMHFVRQTFKPQHHILWDLIIYTLRSLPHQPLGYKSPCTMHN